MYNTSERPKFHLVPTKFPKSVTFSSQQSNKVPSNRRHLKLFLYEICNHATVTDRSSKTFFCFDKKLQKNNFLSFRFFTFARFVKIERFNRKNCFWLAHIKAPWCGCSKLHDWSLQTALQIGRVALNSCSTSLTKMESVALLCKSES